MSACRANILAYLEVNALLSLSSKHLYSFSTLEIDSMFYFNTGIWRLMIHLKPENSGSICTCVYSGSLSSIFKRLPFTESIFVLTLKSNKISEEILGPHFSIFKIFLTWSLINMKIQVTHKSWWEVDDITDKGKV